MSDQGQEETWYGEEQEWFEEESNNWLDLPGVCEDAWYKDEGEGDLSKIMDSILADYNEQLDRGKHSTMEQEQTRASKDDLGKLPETVQSLDRSKELFHGQEDRGHTPDKRKESPHLPDRQGVDDREQETYLPD